MFLNLGERKSRSLTSILLLFLLSTSYAVDDLDNSVVGVPVIQCEREFVHFEVPTKSPFRGRVFVKGAVANAECVRMYDVAEEPDGSNDSNEPDEGVEADALRRHAPQSIAHDPGANVAGSGWRRYLNGGDVGVDKPNEQFRRLGSHESKTLTANNECPLVCPPCAAAARRRRNTNMAQFDVPLSACNAQRDRVLSPPSMQVSFVVIVSFHHQFVTKVDRAYRVQCVFMEAEKIVSAQLGVSMPPTVELASDMQVPTCKYLMTNDRNKLLTHFRVGDEVFHKWMCGSGDEEQANHLGLLVHSCFVGDGKGRKQEVIDERGCSLDPDILSTPHYQTHELSATVSSLVVKFPDVDNVGFECSISVCMKDMGQCDRLTPPDCTRPLVNRTRRHAKESSWRLHAPQLVVLDPDTTGDKNEDLDRLFRPQSAALISAVGGEEENSSFCVSVAGFGLLIASSTFLVTIAVGVLIAACVLRRDPLESATSPFTKNSI